jgi:4-hydroxy-2-oxoheptanedioate aldolase
MNLRPPGYGTVFMRRQRPQRANVEPRVCSWRQGLPGYSRLVPVWIKERLLLGERLLGSFLQLSSPSVVEALVHVGGFDFFCVEGEHSGLAEADVASLTRSVDLLGLPCLVRVAALGSAPIAFALDAGAAGVVVPRVEGPAAAAAVVEASHFPPRGTRGVGPSRASAFGLKQNAYVEESKEALVCVQVETRAGAERVQEIAAVSGVDLVFVGPGDLALSYGLDPVRDADRVRQTVSRILEQVSEAERLTGVYCGTADAARAWLRDGVSLVVLGSDLLFLSSGARQAIPVAPRA